MGHEEGRGEVKKLPFIFLPREPASPSVGMIVLAAALSAATARAGRAALTTSLVCIPRTLSHPVAAQGPDPALSSLELYSDNAAVAQA